MSWAVGLAWRRLTGRPAQSLLVGAAVAAAVALMGTITVLGSAATEQAIQATLAGLDDGERAIRVTAYAPSGANAIEYQAVAATALSTLGTRVDASVPGLIMRIAHDTAGDPYDLQVVAVDDPGTFTQLIEGRLPRPCDGRSCEAVLLSRAAAPSDLGPTVHIHDLGLTIVGRAVLATGVPIGRPDEQGPRAQAADPYNLGTDPPPALLLVNGVDAVAAAPGLDAVGRTYFTTAPIRATTLHAWTMSSLRSSFEAARRALASADLGQTLAGPFERIDEELARAARNAGRLLVTGSMGVAVLIAFAAYAATLGRRGVRDELDRLAAAGASRRQRALLVTLEVATPVLLGALLGAAAGLVAAAALGGMAGTDVSGFLGASVLSAGSVATMGAVGVGGFGVLLAVTVWRPDRAAVRGLIPGLALAAALVGWQLILGGVGGIDRIGTAGSAPAVALLPVVIGIGIGGLAALLAPRLLRRVAAGFRGPVSLHLGLISIARDPALSSASIMMLAFSIGTLIFAAGYQATLRAGIADTAAFQSGLDIRVIEGGSGSSLGATVAPLDRYAGLGPGTTAVPIARINAEAVPGSALTVLGIPPATLAGLRGWRPDFAADPAEVLADKIRVPGVFAPQGHRLAAGDPGLRLPLTLDGDPIGLRLVILSDRGETVTVTFDEVRPDTQTLEAPIPPDGVGGTVIGLVVSEGRIIAGQNHPARLRQSTLTVHGLDGLIDDQPRRVEASGTETTVLRAPAATDQLVVPAVVSPAIALTAATTPSGTVLLRVAGGALLEIRPVATAVRFPTLSETGGDFAVVDLAPLTLALDAVSPGAGRPNEVWVRLDPDVAHGAVVAKLGETPFRSATAIDRAATEEALVDDPLSASVVATLIASALTGLLLAIAGMVLAAAADLRDENGGMRDLEAQGVRPRDLRRMLAARTLLIAGAGVLVGSMVGIAIVLAVTATIGVSADASRPVPPLVPIIPLAAVILLAGLPIVVAAVIAGVAGRVAFRDRAVGR